MQTLQHCLRKFRFFLPTKSWKNHPKSSSEILKKQTAQTEEFMFQNVNYRPVVNKTGQSTLGWSMPLPNNCKY